MTRSKLPQVQYDKIKRLASHHAYGFIIRPFCYVYELPKELVNLIKYIVDKVTFSADDATNIVEIIKIGKEKDVDEMQIICDRGIGLNIDAPISLEGLPEGIQIRCVTGIKNQTVINVKYK